MSEKWSGLVKTTEGWIIAAGCDSFVEAVSFPYRDRSSALWIMESEHPDARCGAPADLMHSLESYFGEYFAGRDPTIKLPIRLDPLTPFTREVLTETARVPWGSVCSYQELAFQIGRPTAARPAGQALGRNPIPIVIPCHRVVSAGGLGGFGGGLCWKRRLLKLEGLDPDRLHKPQKADAGSKPDPPSKMEAPLCAG